MLQRLLGKTQDLVAFHSIQSRTILINSKLSLESDKLLLLLQRLLGKTQDLVAAISGGAEVIRGLQENVTLDGSPSYDPEAAHDDQSGMNFTWHYGKITRNYSFVLETKRDFFTEVNESALQYNGRASGVQISLDTGAMSLGDICIVRLVVTKDYRNASVYQVIHLSKVFLMLLLLLFVIFLATEIPIYFPIFLLSLLLQLLLLFLLLLLP